MDGRRFDRLARALSEAGTRRGLLALLATLPVLGGLFTLLAPEETGAKGRRKRRKKRHRHAQGKSRRRKEKRKNKKKCKPKSLAKTCTGKCGPVKNNCKKMVDCGSCDCAPPCDECFTCQGEAGQPGACVPREAGTPCGDPATCVDGTLTPQGSCDGGAVCQPGTPASCAPYTRCNGNACAITCADDHDCVAGSFCSSEGHCVGDRPDGESCSHAGQCQSGFCVDDVCCNTVCTADCHACAVAGHRGGCVADPHQVGDSCGSDGKTCQVNGACVCVPVDPCTSGGCGTTRTDNCGQSITCAPCPVIASFTASPATIDRGAMPPESATLVWFTSDATSCTLDDGNGPAAVSCIGSQAAGPSATTAYTLTASNATGAEVTAQTTLTVEYCHSITTSGGDCQNTEFCISEPISAGNSAHASEACEACYGEGLCTNDANCGGAILGPVGTDLKFQYFHSTGLILQGFCQLAGGRWAP